MKVSIQQAYTTLGLTSDADEESVRSAYRKLALRFHPDKNPAPEATAKFQEISTAYKRICTHHERRKNGHLDSHSIWDEDGLYSDCDISDEDLDVSFEEMMLMFQMMFGTIGGRRKKAPTKHKNAAKTSAQSMKSKLHVPCKISGRRRRGHKASRSHDSSSASYFDPELLMFEQFMNMSMQEDDWDGNMEEANIMKDMMDLLGATGELSTGDENDEEEIEEVSDWDDEDQDNQTCKSTSHASPSENQATNSLDIKLNDRVHVYGKYPGIVKFIGPVHYAKEDFIGVHLIEPVGKNDGTIKGVNYFNCPPRHGLMLRREDLTVEIV